MNQNKYMEHTKAECENCSHYDDWNSSCMISAPCQDYYYFEEKVKDE